MRIVSLIFEENKNGRKRLVNFIFYDEIAFKLLKIISNLFMIENSERVLSELADVRRKYSQAIFDLEKAKESIKKLELEKINIKISTENADLAESRQIEKLKIQVNELKTENAVLKKQNAVLNARMKQIQSSVKVSKSRTSQHDTHDESSEEENSYEVDRILRHKNGKSGRKFLIRWKGYDSKHDLWLPEEKLNCAKILKNYLRKKQL